MRIQIASTVYNNFSNFLGLAAIVLYFIYLISRHFELRSYEYMEIIYVNCGVKNYIKVDHRCYRRNFCSCEKKA